MLVVTPPKAVDVTKMHISPGIAEPVSFFDLPVVVACWSSPAKSVDTVELSDMESRFLQIAGSGSLILIARYCIVFGVSWLRRSLPVDGRVTLHMVFHLRGRNVRVLRGIHGEGTVQRMTASTSIIVRSAYPTGRIEVAALALTLDPGAGSKCPRMGCCREMLSRIVLNWSPVLGFRATKI